MLSCSTKFHEMKQCCFMLWIKRKTVKQNTPENTGAYFWVRELETSGKRQVGVAGSGWGRSLWDFINTSFDCKKIFFRASKCILSYVELAIYCMTSHTSKKGGCSPPHSGVSVLYTCSNTIPIMESIQHLLQTIKELIWSINAVSYKF